MEAVTRHLERIRRRGRALLLLQRTAHYLAVLPAAALGLGLLDFALRLPVWGRVFLLAIALLAAGTWLVTHVGRAFRFHPSLSELALRAERLFPQLRGSLTSAVEFSLSPEAYANPAQTATFSRASVGDAQARLAGVELNRLIDPKRTLQAMAVLALAALAFATVLLAAPEASRIAAERWLTPTAGTEWPRRTQVANVDEAAVWPMDAPLRLRAAVQRGHSAGMRVTAHYRVIDPDGRAGPRESLLMNEQTAAARDDAEAAVYERLVDLPERLLGLGDADDRGSIEYTIVAGDHRTEPHRVQLVSRPAVTAVTADIAPPDYAEGLIGEQSHSLHRQSSQVATATALTGSRVTLRLALNKPVQLDADTAAALRAMLPGMPEDAQLQHARPTADAEPTPDGDAMPSTDASANGRGGEAGHTITVSFALRETIEAPIRLVDRHGLTNRSERRYRLEAIEDQPVAVSMVEPMSDQAVLPGALVDVEAMAQDDVAVEELTLHAETPDRSESDEPTTGTHQLARETGRQPQMTVRHDFDLAELDLRPGDSVAVYAIALDVFELDGERHDPVRSSERRLRIIDEPTFIGQLRGELAAVRQQARRIDDEQARLVDERPEPDEAQTRQQRLGERMQSQASLVQRLQQRMERNRLDEPALEEMMSRSASLLEQAQTASRSAARSLEQAGDEQDEEAAEAHREQAEADQAAVRAALAELVELLDQSRDALTLTLQLRQLLNDQETLEADTRRLLPQTVGEDAANLPEPLQEALREAGERQREAAAQADELVRRMRSTAAALNREDAEDRDRVSGELLEEAAATAQREGLSEQMEEAGESIDENQLSQAGGQQHDSMETMQRMLREMGKQQERMQALLQRRLEELAQAIERLVEQQQHQNARLEPAEQIVDLEPGQANVRRGTIAVSEQAGRAPETQPIGEVLDQAVNAQGEAILSMRDEQRPPTQVAQREALEHLEAALAQVREQHQEAMEEQVREQREELKAKYEALAERQQALREQTQEAGDAADRRERMRLIELGHEQADLQIDADELGDEAGDVLLFEHLHRRIDRSLTGVVRSLRRATVDGPLLSDQGQVERMFRMLAAALDDDAEPAEFAGEQGGEGGGGGQMPPLIPPVAELKLLRDLQTVVYEQTRSAQQRVAAEGGAAVESQLRDLGGEQRELSALGERLIERMQQMQQAMPGPEPNGEASDE